MQNVGVSNLLRLKVSFSILWSVFRRILRYSSHIVVRPFEISFDELVHLAVWHNFLVSVTRRTRERTWSAPLPMSGILVHHDGGEKMVPVPEILVSAATGFAVVYLSRHRWCREIRWDLSSHWRWPIEKGEKTLLERIYHRRKMICPGQLVLPM